MLKLPVIEIKQPFGTFYAVKLKASELIKIAEADPYRAISTGEFTGVQRTHKEERRKEIANYLRGLDSALPNSIIIAGRTTGVDEDLRWRIEKDGNFKYLIIPKLEKNAMVIDGQHRLNGFQELSDDEKEKYELLCSVYLDIPNPYQAYLFATINMNQKKVDKGLAYELYGYDLNEDDSESWSPEKTAVFLTRKLNFDEDSAFFNHVIVSAENDDVLFEVSPKNQEWFVSTATMVDGILSLISTNAKRDRDKLRQLKEGKRKREELVDDSTPLRKYYKEGNDLLIFTIVKNFFQASYTLLYVKDSYLFKTVGIQAQFRVLKDVLKQNLENDKEIGVEYFKSILVNCKDIDFKDNFFTASGLGKSRIANCILIKIGLMELEKINKEEDQMEVKRILGL